MFFMPTSFVSSRPREVRNAVPWTDDIKWRPYLGIQASSYSPPSLFEVKPTEIVCIRGEELPEESFHFSPSGTWVYSEVILPKGTPLDTFYGAQRGTVAFDGDVLLPRIHEKLKNGWDDDPWMSLSPMEILSMRAGARLARGTTWVAGLGMGYLLKLVAAKKTVKKIVVVEQSQELVDWIMPRLNLQREIEMIVGDAKEIVPEAEGDVALIDIFPTWGSNRFETCPGFKRTWIWGSAKFASSRW